MQGAVGNTVREVAQGMSAIVREHLNRASQGNQAINQQMFQPIMNYIQNLLVQNQIFQYVDQRNQLAMPTLNQLIDNSRRVTLVGLTIDAGHQLQRTMVQQVFNVLQAQGIPHSGRPCATSRCSSPMGS